METIIRKACRALFITPDNHVLLMKIGNADSNWKGWITPGGGIEEGEAEEPALRREIEEELGVTGFEISGKVWTRTHMFPWKGNKVGQSESYFLVSIDHFEPQSTMSLEETEMLDFEKFQWWKIEDIINSEESFAPRNLGNELKAILENGIPENPKDVGI